MLGYRLGADANPRKALPIETERLYMRPVLLTDGETLYHLHRDLLVVRLTSDGIAMSRSQSDSRAVFTRVAGARFQLFYRL